MSLEFVNVGKQYLISEKQINALKNVSIRIDDGEFVAIIGTSGSGKSTFINLAAGLDVPTEGKIYVDDIEITALSKNNLIEFRRDKIGVIYQFYNLVGVLTAEENITLPSALAQKPVDKEKCDDILSMFNLLDRKNHFPNQLSGGQQQRVAIARCLYSDPSIILADEPTGNLDSKNSTEIMDAFVALNQKHKKTVIVVTHDMNVAKRAGRIITINDGEILSDVRI